MDLYFAERENEVNPNQYCAHLLIRRARPYIEAYQQEQDIYIAQLYAMEARRYLDWAVEFMKLN